VMPASAARATTAARARRRPADATGSLQGFIVHPLFLEPRKRPPLALALREGAQMADLFLRADAGERQRVIMLVLVVSFIVGVTNMASALGITGAVV
jgi:hypothetical protein